MWSRSRSVGGVAVAVLLLAFGCGKTDANEAPEDEVQGGTSAGGASSSGGKAPSADPGGAAQGATGGYVIGGESPVTAGGSAGEPAGGVSFGGAAGEPAEPTEGGEAGVGGEATTLSCGDGKVRGTEECDDGDLVDGNGCDADCTRSRVVQLVAGDGFTCALLDSGRVKCWGSNTYGAVGSGDISTQGDAPGEMGPDLPFVDLGPSARASHLSAGARSVCALLSGGTVKCWGQNSRSALGAPYTTNIVGWSPQQMGDALLAVDLGTVSMPKHLDAGHEHHCATFEDDSMKCWGFNNYGQLGQGDSMQRGKVAEQMGDALRFIDWGTGRSVRSVVAGSVQTCALLDDASVECLGAGAFIGLGNGSVVGDSADETGDAVPRVNLGTSRTALALAAGMAHTCAILDDHTLKCWGLGTFGQLGLEDQRIRGVLSNEMGDALPTVDLGTGRTAVTIAAGDYHTCAISNDHTLKCWGSNTNGQLGLGDLKSRGGSSQTMGDALPTVNLGTGRHAVALALGTDHSCALLDDNSVKCWGSSRALGLGNTLEYGGKPESMGDNLPAVALW